MQNVLILCTGNSCRSQMAEGLINQVLGDQWRAYSAGTRPTGYVHPLAIRAMEEVGIDCAEMVSKSADSLRHLTFDRVYTVCDSAAEDCPVWLGGGDVRHLPFLDPAHAQGDEQTVYAVFQQVRDEIRARLLTDLSDN